MKRRPLIGFCVGTLVVIVLWIMYVLGIATGVVRPVIWILLFPVVVPWGLVTGDFDGFEPVVVLSLAAGLWGMIGAFLGWVWSKCVVSDDGGRYCLTCGYCLTGNVTGICPECGDPIDAEVKPAGRDRGNE